MAECKKCEHMTNWECLFIIVADKSDIKLVKCYMEFRYQGSISLTPFPSQFMEIRWKICFNVIPFLVMILLQTFAHATTAQRSCPVQKRIVVIASLYFGGKRNEISITFELRWKFC